MAALTVTWDERITLNGKDYVLSSPSTAPTVTLSELQVYTLSIAATTTKTLWNPAVAGYPAEPASFDYLYCLATVAMYLELACKYADANARTFMVPLAANLPFRLFADDSYYNFTAGGDTYAGTLNVIDKLRVRNPGASAGVLTWALGKT